MIKTISYAGLLALCCTLSAASAQSAPSSSASRPEAVQKNTMNDLKQDPKVLSGVLSNGLHYYIRPNSEPKGRISLRMHVDVGSLSEADDEQGLSHFLEHMVFAGSKNFKIDEVIPTLQRKGLMFGRDVNAYTSFEETVYMIDLPDLKEDSVKTAMTLLRDFADGALFDSKRLDRERGVILNELKTRDSADYRVMKQELGFLLDGCKLVHRLPIGLEKVIMETPREKFVAYHDKHYAADQISFVISGDITPEEGKKLINTYFSSLKPSGYVNTPDRGKLNERTSILAKIVDEPESPMTNLSLSNVTPYAEEADSIENRTKYLPLDMAISMLNRRLQILQKKESCPFVKAYASQGDILKSARQLAINASCAPEKWQPALDVIEQELRKATEYGFTPDEFEEARKKAIQSADQAVETWATRPSDDIADGIIRAIGDKKTFTDPEEDRRILLPALDKLNADICSEALKKAWNPDRIQILATGTVNIPGGEEKLLAAFKESAGKKVEAPEARATKNFAYDHIGTPGAIIDKKEIKDLGITQLKLSNGVTVNYKPTDFQKNTINVLARIDGGKATMPRGKDGLDVYSNFIMNGGGLTAHTNDELERLMAGHTVGVQFGIEEDAFTFSGSTNEKDLELELKLLCANLEHAGYKEEAAVPFTRLIPLLFERLSRESEGVFQKNIGNILTGDDYRFTFPSQEKFSSYTTADVKEWIDSPLKKNALEINIVGDFDPAALEKLLEKTFGALPQRPVERDALKDADKKVQFNDFGGTKVLTYPTSLDKSLTSVIWKSFDAKDKKRIVRLNLLSQILNNRLREEIRDKMSDAYSPHASLQSSDVFDDYGYFMALSPGTSENSERVGEAIRELGANLTKGTITEDEMNRIRRPLLATLEKSLRENNYWLNSGLTESQYKPEKLERLRNRKEDLESITVEELNELAKQIFSPENSIIVRVIPEKTPASPEEKK